MLKGIDFFCGAGGMTHGLLRAGIDVLAGVDNHGPCRETYENATNNRRTCGTSPEFIEADISEPQIVDLIRQVGAQPNDEDLVFAGCSPCQYWSKVNTSRERSAQSRMLLTYFGNIVEIFRPGYVVVENVPGLTRRREESGLMDFLRLLERTGFAYDERVLRLCHYGVPQKRDRYLLLATRRGTAGTRPVIELPEAAHSADRFPDGMSVRHFIGPDNGFPMLAAGERLESPPLHWAAALSSDNQRRIQMTAHDGGSRAAWMDEADLQIDAYRGKEDIFRDVYGRMRWDEPAPTITTRFNSLSNGRFGHPVEDRAISLREGATLQTFPLTYSFPRSCPEAARQIGNAVPPELARRIGEQIVRHYENLMGEGQDGNV